MAYTEKQLLEQLSNLQELLPAADGYLRRRIVEEIENIKADLQAFITAKKPATGLLR